MDNGIGFLNKLDSTSSGDGDLITLENMEGHYSSPKAPSETEAGSVYDFDQAQERADIVSGKIEPKDNPEGSRFDKFFSQFKGGAAGRLSSGVKSLNELGLISGTARVKATDALGRYQKRETGTYKDYYSHFKARDKEEFLDWFVAQSGSGLGQQVPSALAAIAAGGIATKLKLGKKAIMAIAAGTQRSATWLSIFGQEVEDMRVDGGDASEAQKIGAALISTGIQTEIELVFGPQSFVRSIFKGVGAKSVVTKVIEKHGKKRVKDIGFKFMTGALNVGVQGLGEGVEEGLQAYTHDIASKVLNEDHEMSDFGELLSTQILPAIPAGLWGGVGTIITQEVKKGLARSVAKSNEKKWQAVLKDLSESELKSFNDKINEIQKGLSNFKNIKDEGEAAKVVSVIVKVALGIAHDTGKAPDIVLDRLNLIIAKRGITADEIAAYKGKTQVEQEQWLKDSGIITVAEDLIDEQVDKERKRQTDRLKVDSDKVQEKGRSILTMILGGKQIQQDTSIDSIILETMSTEDGNIDIADIESTMPYGTGDPISELIETRRDLIDGVKRTETKDPATMRDIVRLTNAIDERVASATASAQKTARDNAPLVAIAEKIKNEETLTAEEEQERVNNSEAIDAMLKDAVEGENNNNAVVDYENALSSDEDIAIVGEAIRESDRVAQKAMMEAKVAEKNKSGEIADENVLNAQGKKQVSKFNERADKKAELDEQNNLSEPVEIIKEEVVLPNTDIVVKEGAWLPMASMPKEWLIAMYIHNSMTNAYDGKWINLDTHEIRVPSDMGEDIIAPKQTEGLKAVTLEEADAILARRASIAQQSNEAELVDKLKDEAESIYERLQAREETLFSEGKVKLPKAQYFKHSQRMVFYPTATAQELLHEFFHHLSKSNLLTREQRQSLLEASGETIWNLKAEEFSARAFELYFMEKRVPENVSKEWLNTANRVRNYLALHGDDLIGKGYELSDEISNMFSKVIESSEKYTTEMNSRLNKQISKAIGMSMDNSDTLFSEEASVSTHNRNDFHDIRDTFDKVTKLDSRKILQDMGLKSYLTVKHAREDGVDQAENITDQDMALIRNVLLTDDKVKEAYNKKRKKRRKRNPKKEQPKEGLANDIVLKGKRLKRRLEANKAGGKLAIQMETIWNSSRLKSKLKGIRRNYHKSKDAFFSFLATPENFFKTIDGGEYGIFSEFFGDRMREGSRNFADGANNALDFVTKSMGVNDVEINKELYATHNIEGRKYQLWDLIGIYMFSKNKRSMKSLVLSDGMTPATIAEATTIVEGSTAAKTAIKTINEYMENIWKPLSDAVMLVTGRSMGKVEGFYLSLIYKDGNISDDNLARLESLEGQEDMRTELMRNISASKARSNIAQGGELELNAEKIFLRYMYSAENYIAQAGNTKYMLDALNNKDLQREITATHGSAVLKEMKSIVSRGMSPTGRVGEFGPFEKALMNLRGKAVSSFLGYNPFTMARQPVSLLTAMSFVNAPKTVMNFVKQFYLGIAGGGFDIDNLKASQDFKDMISESPEMKIRARQGLIDPDMDAEFMSKIKSNGLKGLRFTDMATIVSVYTVAKNEKLSEGMDMKDAIRYAKRVVRKSQPPTTVSERSLMQTSNEYIRSSIMFTGQPFKNWNIYMYDIVMPIFYGGQKEGVKGVVKALNETKRAALFAVALPAMAMSFIAKKRLPKTWREFFIDLLAYPMSAFPILGASMSRRLQGWDQATFETLYQSVSKGIEEVLADVVSGKMDITDGSDLWKSTKEIQKLALLVYGQPQFPVKVMNKVFEDLVQRGVAEDIPEAMDFIKRVTNLEPAPPPSKQ